MTITYYDVIMDEALTKRKPALDLPPPGPLPHLPEPAVTPSRLAQQSLYSAL